MGLKINEKRVEKEIRKTFPKAIIINYKKFEKGLAHQTFKVKIKKPNKYLVTRIYKLKNRKKVDANTKALIFLNKKGFPTPKIYSDIIFRNQGILIMEYLKGEQAEEILPNSPEKIKIKILKNAGELLRKLHMMPIPKFWKHFKHEVKNNEEWIKWTRQRIKKYSKFSKENLDDEYYKFLKGEFEKLSRILSKNIELVPMHWDFHLGNILANKKGDILG